jgi:type II secretory pathway component PulF
VPIELSLLPGERELRTARVLETMAGLLDAGLSPRVALDQEGLRRAMGAGPHAAAKQVLERGASLAEALAAAGLRARDASRVRASEAAGRTAEGLRRIAEERTRAVAMLRLTLGKLLYPVFIVHFAALARAITAGLFLGNNVAGLRAALALALPIDAGLLALALAVRNAASGGRCAQWGLKVPLLAALLRDGALAPFLWSLRDFHDSGVPLDRAVGSAAEGTPTFFAGPMGRAAGEVRSGRALTGAVAATGLVDDTTLAILQPSEVAGMLSEGLARAALLVEQRFVRGLAAAARIPGAALYGLAVVVVVWTLYSFYVSRLALPAWFQ